MSNLQSTSHSEAYKWKDILLKKSDIPIQKLKTKSKAEFKVPNGGFRGELRGEFRGGFRGRFLADLAGFDQKSCGGFVL